MSEQPKKLKKLTQLDVRKSWALTQECYCKALVDTYPKELEGAKPESFRTLGVDRELRAHLNDLDLPSQSPEIHRRYMQYVKQLTTKQLEKIIMLNDQGLVRRAPHTIDEIQLEILDRSLTEASDGDKRKTN